MDYVKKDGTYISNIEQVLPKKQLNQAKRNALLVEQDPLKTVQDGLISLLQLPQLIHARNLYRLLERQEQDVVRECFWIVGQPGTGKSRFCFAMQDAFEKPQNKWWDGYRGESIVIIDDLDTDALGHYLKRWADRYPVKGEVKNGTVNLSYRRLFVTSNHTIESLFEKHPGMIAPL